MSKHLGRRRDRLRRMLSLVRQAQRTGSETAAASYDQEKTHFKEQWKQLDDIRKLLATSERKMIKKWARPRALANVARLLVLLAISVGLVFRGAGSLSADRLLTAQLAN